MGQDKVQEENAGVNDGRRKLIKAVAVAGGAAVAVAALPGEWKKPLATVGGLPAHAQTSDNQVVLIPGSFRYGGILDARRADAARYFSFDSVGTFEFEDPLCKVDDTWSLTVDVGPCTGILKFTQTLQDNGASFVSGDKCAGTIQFNFMVCNQSSSIPQSVELRLSKGARRSTVLNAEFSTGKA